MVDYSKWDKMKFSSSEDEDDGVNFKSSSESSSEDEDNAHVNVPEIPSSSKADGNFHMEELRHALLDKLSWWTSLSEKERYEWFVDCYRMRVDDDYVWGGGNLHGLYDPDPMDGKKLAVIKDFLIFMKLAVKNMVIPMSDGFSFGECLKEAASLLPYAFEKSDAQEKWGGENVFSTRPSLRRTAESVYGSSSMPHPDQKEDNLYTEIEEEVENGVKNKFQNSSKKLFEEVGGFDLWLKLYRTLSFKH